MLHWFRVWQYEMHSTLMTTMGVIFFLGAKVGWRTCKLCALSGTKKQLDGKGSGECKDEGKELPTQGKLNECTHCSLCYKLEIAPETITLHVIPPDMLDKHNLESRFSAGTYLTEKTKAECKPLARRLVYNADGTTLYNDEYRKTIYDSTVYQVPSFHTVIRVLNNCTLKKCSEVCDGIFEYSPGCGPQISNTEDMWVIYGQNRTTLKSVNDHETLKKGLFVTNSPCSVCKTCEKGYYNDECNVYRDGVHPQGMCKSCRLKCDAGEYMHHKDGDGRCDFPLSTRQHTDSLWKVTSNYECRRCPTWVLEKRNDKQFLHTVTACGERSQYEALGFDINNNLAIQSPHAHTPWVGSRSPDGWDQIPRWAGGWSCTNHTGVLGSIPKREEPGFVGACGVVLSINKPLSLPNTSLEASALPPPRVATSLPLAARRPSTWSTMITTGVSATSTASPRTCSLE